MDKPLRLTVETGAGTYRIEFDDWRGQPLTPNQVEQLHAALDRALLAVNIRAASAGTRR